MRTLAMLLIAGLLALAACGDAGENGGAGTQPSSDPTVEREAGAAVAENDERAAGAEDTGEARERDGTAVRAAKSEFGRMLFDSDGQAVYVFEPDPPGRSEARARIRLAELRDAADHIGAGSHDE